MNIGSLWFVGGCTELTCMLTALALSREVMARLLNRALGILREGGE